MLGEAELRVGGEDVKTRQMDCFLEVWGKGKSKENEGNPDKGKESMKMKRERRVDIFEASLESESVRHRGDESKPEETASSETKKKAETPSQEREVF